MKVINIIQKTKYAKLIYLDNGTFFKLGNSGFKHLKINTDNSIDNFDFIKEKFILPAIEYKITDLLMKKDYSEKELYDKLYRYGYSKEYVSSIIKFLKSKNYVNDENYCRELIENYSQRYGIYKIKNKLYEKGIPSEIIEKCFNDIEFDSIDVIKKQVASLNINDISDYKIRKKIINKLLYRGFTMEDINEVIDLYSSRNSEY